MTPFQQSCIGGHVVLYRRVGMGFIHGPMYGAFCGSTCPFDKLRVMVRYSNHEALEGEALNRWYGIKTPQQKMTDGSVLERLVLVKARKGNEAYLLDTLRAENDNIPV